MDPKTKRSEKEKKEKKQKRDKNKDKWRSSKRQGGVEKSEALALVPEALATREWKPTPRACLSSGARETGVKVQL